MRKILSSLLLALTFIHAPALGQRRIKAHVVNNSVAIQSISIGEPNDADLQAIGAAIGEARVVMLGEQDHGDAPTFKAKARLIRYLHEQHGFNVLAFESDFVGLTGGYEEVRSGRVSLDSLLRGNLFAIWTTCVQFGDTWNYLRASEKTSNPLRLAGFDNQLHGAYTAKHLRNMMRGLLRRDSTKPIFNIDEERYLGLLDSLVRYSARGSMRQPPSDYNWFEEKTAVLLQQLQSGGTVDSFSLMAVENILSTCRHQRLMRGKPAYPNWYAERDVQMAKNLHWLATVKYPREKIIVWAANGHVSRNQNIVQLPRFRHETMGRYFTEALGNAHQTYVLGFSSFEGRAGRTTMKDSHYPLPGREDKSFERWIDKKGRAFAFVDFRLFNERNRRYFKRFTMSAPNHFQQKGAWHKAYDGVFFIRAMYACDRQD